MITYQFKDLTVTLNNFEHQPAEPSVGVEEWYYSEDFTICNSDNVAIDVDNYINKMTYQEHTEFYNEMEVQIKNHLYYYYDELPRYLHYIHNEY